MDDNERKIEFGKWNYSVALNSPDKDQAARGALILHRLVPAPDHGRGFRRDPDTGFVYYSSEWLSDERTWHGVCLDCGDEWVERVSPPAICPECHSLNVSDAKAPE